MTSLIKRFATLFALACLLAGQGLPPTLPQRMRPTSPPTFYLSPVGNDANVASLCAASAPCLTPQYVLDWLFMNLDAAGQPVTVQLACGTYPGFEIRGDLVGHYGTPTQNGQYTFYVRGDPNCPIGNVIVDGSLNGRPAIGTKVNKSMHVGHLTLQTGNTGQPCVGVDLVSEFVIHEMNFGKCLGGHVNASGNVTVLFNGDLNGVSEPITISGDAPWFVYADELALVRSTGPVTVRVQGARSFSQFLVGAARKSIVDFSNSPMTFDLSAGSVAGVKWKTYDGAISILGANPQQYFPGTVDGFNTLGGSVY